MFRHEARTRLASLGIVAGFVLLLALLSSRGEADEIRFKTHSGVQEGTVLEESGGSITIRFSRGAIESFTRSSGPPDAEPQREPDASMGKRVQTLEKKESSLPAARSVADTVGETGSVEGTIRWNHRPLAHGKVMIVPVGGVALSLAIQAGRHPGDVAGAPSGKKVDRYETETDASGRYRFDGVPSGEYRLYWMPDARTGWVHRLREDPDLDVTRGGVTVLNIPAGKK